MKFLDRRNTEDNLDEFWFSQNVLAHTNLTT